MITTITLLEDLKALSSSLYHNKHKMYYETISQYCLNRNTPEGASKDIVWVSPEQEEKAIQQDSMWELRWYPRTPISFYLLWACDLDVLIRAALAVDEETQ